MARPRKKKHGGSSGQTGQKASSQGGSAQKGPKSMVIRIGAGEVGPSVSQLVKDVRSVMEPDTAIRLKERRSNRLRDYTAMAGPLGVSHLLLFSRSSSGNTNLRLALTPRGPTLHFRVEKYSLAKDVRNAQRHPQMAGNEHMTPPLLVMNNFLNPEPSSESARAVPKHLESLTTSIFQSLFPPISPQATPLSSIRRVLLLNRELEPGKTSSEEGSYVLNFRHYAITTKRVGLSRSIRRINTAQKLMKQRKPGKNGFPNLGRLEDISEFLLDPSAAASGFTSGSESEADSDAGVEVLEVRKRKVLNRKQMEARRASGSEGIKSTRPEAEKRSVKLVELGPRMKLRMTKVEEGVCNGKVMWHDYLQKTNEEMREMETVWEKRKQEKEERRRIQKENVEKKRAAQTKPNKGASESQDQPMNDEQDPDMEDVEEDWDSEGFEDDDTPFTAHGTENQVVMG